MSFNKLDILLLALVAFSVASPCSAQDVPKRGALQEDPILRSVDSAEPSEEMLSLPSDPQRVRDSKVQEDPLLSDLDGGRQERHPTAAGKRTQRQDDSPAAIESDVERDPILGQRSKAPPASTPDKKQARPKRHKRKRQDTKQQSERDSRLVPKPKDSSVQEDPLLRSVDPRR